jgi:prevent-host-death family protein
MNVQVFLNEPNHIDEPHQVDAYSDLLSQVAADGRPVIVRRNGEDLAAVIPLASLEVLRELAAREEVERLAAQIDWDRLVKTNPPPQEWFDREEPKPF